MNEKNINGDSESGKPASSKLPKDAKILLAPTNFAGIAGYVADGLRERGYHADHMIYTMGQENPFGFNTGEIVNLKELGGRIPGQTQVLKNCLDRDYDIYHFWNRSLFFKIDYTQVSGADIMMLRARGKKIIHRFTGYDVRLETQDKEVNPYSAFNYGLEYPVKEEMRRIQIEFLRQYADGLLVQDPELQQFCPEAKIIPRALDLKKWDYVGVSEQAPDFPLVVHSSSVAAWKGTEFVLQAVEDLKDRGVKFNFKLVEGMPSHEAAEWYKRADIIIDGLLVGTTGVTTLEGWALGKPVINYTRLDLFEPFYGQKVPVLSANPDNIGKVLYEAIKDHEHRKELAVEGRKLVEKFHDLDVVIDQFVDYYGEIYNSSPKKIQGDADLEYMQMQIFNWQGETRRANRAENNEKNIRKQINQLKAQKNKKVAKQSLLGHAREFMRKHFLYYDGKNFFKNYVKWTFRLVEGSLAFRVNAADLLRNKPYDLYQSHDVFAAWAAVTMSKVYKGAFIADVVELPRLQERNGSDFRKITVPGAAFHNAIDKNNFKKADALLTVSETLQDWLQENIEKETHVIRNARPFFFDLDRNALRREIDVDENATIIAQINTLGPPYGIEETIEALAGLPEDHVLVLIGRYMNDEFENHINQQIDRLKLGKRVFYLGVRQAEEMIHLTSGADVGICVLDKARGNNRHALPNRLFDFIAARIPVVGSDTGDIGRVIENYDMGEVIDSRDPQQISAAIEKVLKKKKAGDYEVSLKTASMELSWDKEKDHYVKLVENTLVKKGKKLPAKVCILARKKIEMNNRIIKQAAALSARGHQVTVVAVSLPSEVFIAKCPKVDFRVISANYQPKHVDE